MIMVTADSGCDPCPDTKPASCKATPTKKTGKGMSLRAKEKTSGSSPETPTNGSPLDRFSLRRFHLFIELYFHV